MSSSAVGCCGYLRSCVDRAQKLVQDVAVTMIRAVGATGVVIGIVAAIFVRNWIGISWSMALTLVSLDLSSAALRREYYTVIVHSVLYMLLGLISLIYGITIDTQQDTACIQGVENREACEAVQSAFAQMLQIAVVPFLVIVGVFMCIASGGITPQASQSTPEDDFLG